MARVKKGFHSRHYSRQHRQTRYTSCCTSTFQTDSRTACGSLMSRRWKRFAVLMPLWRLPSSSWQGVPTTGQQQLQQPQRRLHRTRHRPIPLRRLLRRRTERPAPARALLPRRQRPSRPPTPQGKPRPVLLLRPLRPQGRRPPIGPPHPLVCLRALILLNSPPLLLLRRPRRRLRASLLRLILARFRPPSLAEVCCSRHVV